MNEFLQRMREILKDDFDNFLKSMDEKPYRGLRINTLKCDKDKLIGKLNFDIEKTPFCDDGYYIDDDVRVGTHPLHHAGALYVQEPSAMSAVTMLCVKPGDRVLDLCAAPGSKTTQIAQNLKGEGMLWSNEIVRNRANILLSNIERMGITNAVVSSTSPQKLSEELKGYFDKILVDAPCSGEGMFRKDKDAYKEWSVEHVISCADRQLSILNSAKSMLRAGGEMVYSTCTYSYEENEGVVTRFLSQNPEFELIDSGCSFGVDTLNFAKRIFPMNGGEGHFAAKFRKREDAESDDIILNKKKDKRNKQKPYMQKADSRAYEFLSELFVLNTYKNLYKMGDRVYAVNDECEKLLSGKIDISKLSVLRIGVEVLIDKGKRYEPLHNAFTACKVDDCKNIVDLSLDDDRVYRYLHGEGIECDSSVKGYTCVCVEGIPLTFAKAVDGVLKNKYPKGLRNLNGKVD